MLNVSGKQKVTVLHDRLKVTFPLGVQGGGAA